MGIGDVPGGQTHAFLWSATTGMTDLGTLPGDTSSVASFINNLGQVIGFSSGTDGTQAWFLWSANGGMVNLDTLLGSPSQVASINENGQIVGSFYVAGTVHAFIWSADEGIQDLGSLIGDTDSVANAINDAGQVVGFYTAADGSQRPFLWSQETGMKTDFGTLPPDKTPQSANDINNNGQIVGFSFSSGYDFSAFYWSTETGSMDLGMRLGVPRSLAVNINDVGQVVGWISSAWFRGFLWTEENGMIPLPTLPGGGQDNAFAVNNEGLIVGWSELASPTGEDVLPIHAVLWSLDAEAPTIVIDCPTDCGIYAANSGAVFHITVSDNLDSSPDVAMMVTGWDSSFTVASGDALPNESGVYTLNVIATDDSGNSASKTLMFIVYDSSAGFVTGGGWIQSPEGAYKYDSTLCGGRASFGFVSKYQKGAHVPTGNTEFTFHVDNFKFKSTSYEWLVVAGTKAQFKGLGTINGAGNYGFMLTAEDGDNKGQDTFRIKIWDASTEAIIYDNGAQSPIGGGNIILHK